MAEAEDTGYVLVADVLGFRQIVSNLTGDELHGRIEQWVSLVRSAADRSGIGRVMLLSDTVFAATPGTESGLRSLLGFSKLLLSEGIRASLPVRGGIAHGEYVWGEMIYGAAVLAAHGLEQRQDWIGIACEPNLPNLDPMFGYGSLLPYLVPFRHGPLTVMPVVDWEVPTAADLMHQVSGKGLMGRTEPVDSAVYRKLRNTVEYRLYRDLVRSEGRAPNGCWSLAPIQLIETAVLCTLSRPALPLR